MRRGDERCRQQHYQPHIAGEGAAKDPEDAAASQQRGDSLGGIRQSVGAAQNTGASVDRFVRPSGPIRASSGRRSSLGGITAVRNQFCQVSRPNTAALATRRASAVMPALRSARHSPPAIQRNRCHQPELRLDRQYAEQASTEHRTALEQAESGQQQCRGQERVLSHCRGDRCSRAETTRAELQPGRVAGPGKSPDSDAQRGRG